MTREYSSISVETTLNSGINTTATTMVLPSVAAATALLGGVSLAPGNVDIFTVAIDVDTINEEIVYVTGVSGDTLTISRGQAGTGTPGVSGIAHSAGATIKHVLTSSDLIYFNTAIQPDTLTAKGDIYAASASATVGRVGVGTNGQVLTADSSQTRGLAWTTVSSTPRIGQVVSATSTTSTTTSSAGSFVDITGLSVTITPTSATSKILVMATCQFGTNQGTTSYSVGQTKLLRDATSLYTALLGSYFSGGTPPQYLVNYITPSIQWVDSPATTSATTYKLQMNMIFSGVNLTANGSSNAQITAMEILV
jgi:hypothetical protein